MHRRDVLKFFSLAALTSVAPIGELGFLTDRVFESTPFGIRLTTPGSWHSLLTPDYLKLLDRDYGDKNPKVPILACTRFLEPNKRENDTFFIFADRIRNNVAKAPGVPAKFKPLDLVNTRHEYYSFTATTTDHRDLSFIRDEYFFHDRSSMFHLEFEWAASSPDRSAVEFRNILNSIQLAHSVSPGWC